MKTFKKFRGRLDVGGICGAAMGCTLVRLDLGGCAWHSSCMLDEGVWADVRVGGEHLRLFSEHNAQGVQASVYNVNAKSWIAPSEAVEDIEQGKYKAAAYAEEHLRRTARLELPPLVWKKSRSV